MAPWPEVQTVKAENRHELVLSGSVISKKISDNGIDDELFLCDGLNFLCISETQLSEVPIKIAQLNNLTSLVLHSNKLTALCPEVGKLSKLKLLDASGNEITKIPEEVCDLEHLQTLNLSFNKIAEIPDVKRNTWLSTVDLSRNAIEDISFLCQKELVHLSELLLKGNQITEVPVSIQFLSSLKTLDLSDNKIKQIPAELADISKLKDIKLDQNPLSDRRLGKLVIQCKPKQILDYVREHCPRSGGDAGGKGGKKGKAKGREKNNSTGSDPTLVSGSKPEITVSKVDDGVVIVKRNEFVQQVRAHVVACVVRGAALDADMIRTFIQLQNKLHDTVCDKRNLATIASHDMDKVKGRRLTYTALSPDGLVIVPLNKGQQCTGKELFRRLEAEAEALRKEKKRNTYSGIHKFLYLLDKKPLYPCLLDATNVVISFPPITNSDITKISVGTQNMLLEVTSSTSQGVAKKVMDSLLREMLLAGLMNAGADDTKLLKVEQVRVEQMDGTLDMVYPGRADLTFEDSQVAVSWE